MLINSFERKNFTPKNAVSKGILLRLSRHQPATRATIVPIPAPDPNMEDANGKAAYGPIANIIPAKVPKNIPLNPASFESQLLTNSSGMRTSMSPANMKAPRIRGAVCIICLRPAFSPSYCFPFFFELTIINKTAAILNIMVV